ncbi:MAG: DMT family transporter [bacterium]|nr:DMT family transporter [bacterium]
MTKPRDLAGIAAVLLASTIWGASFVLAKLALEELPVAHVLLYRFLFSAGPLVPFLLASRGRPGSFSTSSRRRARCSASWSSTTRSPSASWAAGR